MDAIAGVERGRESYARRAWLDVYESLSGADQAKSLGAQDLELLARSAYMLGRDDDYVSGLERDHHAHMDSREVLRAVRCAFWIGHNLMCRGETGPAMGWFARRAAPPRPPRSPWTSFLADPDEEKPRVLHEQSNPNARPATDQSAAPPWMRERVGACQDCRSSRWLLHKPPASPLDPF